MPERFDLEIMYQEIEEDEKVALKSDKKITQEEIQKMIMNKKVKHGGTTGNDKKPKIS